MESSAFVSTAFKGALIYSCFMENNFSEPLNSPIESTVGFSCYEKLNFLESTGKNEFIESELFATGKKYRNQLEELKTWRRSYIVQKDRYNSHQYHIGICDWSYLILTKSSADPHFCPATRIEGPH